MRLSVIVPTLNEEEFIEECVRSLRPTSDMEILIVDGGSTDGTRDRVALLQAEFPQVRLVDNSAGRTAAAAMNVAIPNAKGTYVARVDAHATYGDRYLDHLLAALERSGAAMTGGVWEVRPRRATLWGRAVAAGVRNPWVMGRAAFRTGAEEAMEVDTVPFGCWRAEVVRGLGGFDERLTRSQDFDLYSRIRRAGGSIILVPEAKIFYYSRSGVTETLRYTFWNGFWVGYPAVAFSVRFSVRHLVPAAAVMGGVVMVGIACTTSSSLAALLSLPYVVVLVASGFAARSEGRSVAFVMPFLALETHVLYGVGTWWGILRGTARRWNARHDPPPMEEQSCTQ